MSPLTYDQKRLLLGLTKDYLEDKNMDFTKNALSDAILDFITNNKRAYSWSKRIRMNSDDKIKALRAVLKEILDKKIFSREKRQLKQCAKWCIPAERSKILDGWYTSNGVLLTTLMMEKVFKT